MMKLVLDTCVIESALRSSLGASFLLVNAIDKSLFRYGLSTSLFLEYEYRIHHLVSSRQINFNDSESQAFLQAIGFFAEKVNVFYTIRPNLRDENDNHVLECAVNYGADFLVTHNIRDFLNADLQPYSVNICTPQDAIRRLQP